MHLRAQLRADAVTALTAAATGAAVSGVRQYARGADDLPAIEVSTPASARRRISDDGTFEVDLSLAVTAIVAVASDAEGAADALAEAIEGAIFGMADSAPYVASILDATSEFDAGDPGERRPARLATVFTVRVYAEEIAPQTPT